jgi:hypothetical protein
MREPDPHRDFGRTTDDSDHDRRNRSQDELLRLAMARHRHAQYIDTMLRRTGERQTADQDPPQRPASPEPDRRE